MLLSYPNQLTQHLRANLLRLVDSSLRLDGAETTYRYWNVYIIIYGFDALATILLFLTLYMLLNHWLTTAGSSALPSASFSASTEPRRKSGWVWLHWAFIVLLVILMIVDVGLFAGLTVNYVYIPVKWSHQKQVWRLIKWVKKYGSAVQFVVLALALEVFVCACWCRAVVRRRAPGLMVSYLFTPSFLPRS